MITYTPQGESNSYSVIKRENLSSEYSSLTLEEIEQGVVDGKYELLDEEYKPTYENGECIADAKTGLIVAVVVPQAQFSADSGVWTTDAPKKKTFLVIWSQYSRVNIVRTAIKVQAFSLKDVFLEIFSQKGDELWLDDEHPITPESTEEELRAIFENLDGNGDNSIQAIIDEDLNMVFTV